MVRVSNLCGELLTSVELAPTLRTVGDLKRALEDAAATPVRYQGISDQEGSTPKDDRGVLDAGTSVTPLWRVAEKFSLMQALWRVQAAQEVGTPSLLYSWLLASTQTL